MVHMLEGKPPNSDLDEIQVLFRVGITGEVTYNLPQSTSVELQSLLEQMLD